jgi:Transposase DDE domain group 1
LIVRISSLFDIPGYTFHAVVTNLSLPPEEVWHFYNRRADCENRIKELRLDFAADGFCLKSFSGTEAVLQLNTLLFNLIAAFKEEVLRDSSPTLGTLRHTLLVLGVLADKTRYRLSSLLERLDALIPTVAQFLPQSPPPWRKRLTSTPDFLRYCPPVPL